VGGSGRVGTHAGLEDECTRARLRGVLRRGKEAREGGAIVSTVGIAWSPTPLGTDARETVIAVFAVWQLELNIDAG
jgi:hypothetical protein